MTLSDRLFEEGVFAQGIALPDRRRATRRASAPSSPPRTRATSCSSRSTSFAQGRPRARDHARERHAASSRGSQDFFDTYTQDLTADDLQRLFTRDTRDAYQFFTRGIDADALQSLPWHQRASPQARMLFLAFTMKLSPARRVVYGARAACSRSIGLVNLFRGVGIIEILRAAVRRRRRRARAAVPRRHAGRCSSRSCW